MYATETTTTAKTNNTMTTSTTQLIVDFSVSNQTILNEFIVIFTQSEFFMTDEKLTKSATCNETSNVAVKFEQFDTTAYLVLTDQNGSIIFSKTHLAIR